MSENPINDPKVLFDQATDSKGGIISRSAHEEINEVPSYLPYNDMQPGQFMQFRTPHNQLIVMCDPNGIIHAWRVYEKLA